MRLLVPEHPVFHHPNAIREDDWAGWVQERGLYFAGTWDAAYTPLLSMADPGGEPVEGGLLVAPLGEGTYVYTGLAFFRQLPAGVPGSLPAVRQPAGAGADGERDEGVTSSGSAASVTGRSVLPAAPGAEVAGLRGIAG